MNNRKLAEANLTRMNNGNLQMLKTVWITGASSGIGAALSRAYSKNGYFIILSGRNRQKLVITQQSLKDPKQSAIYSFDTTDYSLARSVASEILDKYGCPDITILNAGVSQRDYAEGTALSVTQQIINTNFIANVNISNQLIPAFRSSQKKLVVISSVTGKLGTKKRSSYAASKHALHGYYDSLRAELYGSDSTITIVCPGYVRTNISINALLGNGDNQNSMDDDTNKGMSPEKFALKVLKSVEKNKREVYIGGFEILAIYIKRFFPNLLAKIIRRVNPK